MFELKKKREREHFFILTNKNCLDKVSFVG